ncbi:MAG: SDR family oxidoreductase, partial [Pseudomonadota bacterium]|nr:SDR family oxidoreductase [Pseudomonadota bacterium]
MQIDLTGKRALVTGSTSGIGYAIARTLADAGATVTINGRSEAGVAAALDRLKQTVPGALLAGVAADLGNAAGCAQLLAALPEVDILINNVGMYYHQDFFAIDDAGWQAMLELNFMAGMRLARGYLPGMVARGWGRVQFVSSECGLQIPVEMIHYGVSKTANLALARGLAKRVAG